MSDKKYGSSRLAEIVIEDPHKCFVCSEYVPDNVIECPACGFPQNGDEASQRWFLGDLRVKKTERNQAGFAIDRAFGYLLNLPLFFLLLAFFLWKEMHKVLYAQLFLIAGLTFLSIWIFGRKRPKLAFALSLGLYALFSIPVMCYYPRIILATKFFIFAPYIFLWIGFRSYSDWEMLDEEIGDKNSG
jgi:hypothetical protein